MKPITNNPKLPYPIRANSVTDVSNYDQELVKWLYTYFAELALRVNALVPKDGSEAMSGPLDMGGYDISNVANITTSANITVGGHLTVAGDITADDIDADVITANNVQIGIGDTPGEKLRINGYARFVDALNDLVGYVGVVGDILYLRRNTPGEIEINPGSSTSPVDVHGLVKVNHELDVVGALKKNGLATRQILNISRVTVAGGSTTSASPVAISDLFTYVPTSPTSSVLVIISGFYGGTQGTSVDDFGAVLYSYYYTGTAYASINYESTNAYLTNLGGPTVNKTHYWPFTKFILAEVSHRRSDSGNWAFRMYGETVYTANTIVLGTFNVFFIEIEAA